LDYNIKYKYLVFLYNFRLIKETIKTIIKKVAYRISRSQSSLCYQLTMIPNEGNVLFLFSVTIQIQLFNSFFVNIALPIDHAEWTLYPYSTFVFTVSNVMLNFILLDGYFNSLNPLISLKKSKSLHYTPVIMLYNPDFRSNFTIMKVGSYIW